MFSIRWHDGKGPNLVIGDRESIAAVYTLLNREIHAEKDKDLRPRMVQVRDVGAGIEVDPERGWESKAFLVALEEARLLAGG